MIEGPILGKRNGKVIRYPGDKHLLTVAPNGSGKDVSCVTLNAMTHTGSLIVCDVKGETAKLTAKHRAKVLGQRVYVFDPYRIVPDDCIPQNPTRVLHNPDGTYRMFRPALRARFNPLDMIRMSNSQVSIAKMIAASIIIPDDGKPHWGNGARSMLGAFMAFAALEPGYLAARNIGSVWDDLNRPNAVRIDAEGNKYPGEFDDLLDMMTYSKSAARYPAREAIRFLDGAHDEVRGIKNSVFTNCGSILDDPEILEVLSESDVDLADIQREPITIYLCLPGYLQDSHSRWMRLMLTCILAAVERSGIRQPGSDKPRTLWLLNEWASQRRNDVMLEALPRMRGHGQQFWIFVQDLSQLRYWYKDAWETFVSNTGVVQAFGGSPDVFTSEYLSKMTGQQTIIRKGTSESTRAGAGTSTNASPAPRPVLYPHEITSMNAKPEDELRQLLIFARLGSTSKTQRMLYYKDLPLRN